MHRRPGRPGRSPPSSFPPAVPSLSGAELGELGAGCVQVPLGALGACALLAPAVLQDPGAVVEQRAELVAFAGCVSAQLLQLAVGALAGPGRLGLGVLGPGLGRRGPPQCLLRFGTGLVTGGPSGADLSCGGFPGLADLLGGALGGS